MFISVRYILEEYDCFLQMVKKVIVITVYSLLSLLFTDHIYVNVHYMRLLSSKCPVV